MSRGWRIAGGRRGAVAVLFALMAVPLIGFLALAVDVGLAVWARSRLAMAADAAAIAAVMEGANDFSANPSASMVPAQLAGTKRFAAQLGSLSGVAVNQPAVTVTVSGAKISATVAYSAKYTTHFAQLFGVSAIPIGGLTTSSRTDSPYFDIEILMDNSSSMAIPSTQAGMTQMGKLVQASPLFAAWGQSQACSFACHFDTKNNDFYGIALANGVQLRIAVMQQAAQGVLATIQASTAAAQFQVGLYTFTTGLTTVYPTGSNLTAASAAIGAVTVPVTTNGGDADTNIPAALTSLTNLIPASGDGSTVLSPRRYLFIVTDGVADYYTSTGARVLAPLSPSACAALKAEGVQILTLYTQYIPIPTNAYYVANVAPFISQVQPNLVACASSAGFAFSASDATSISTAMQAMLLAAINSPARITQ